MAEDERTKKNQELKLKKRDYTGYDDDEFVEGNQGMKRAVLAKYDEDIEGTRETVSKRFLLFLVLITSTGLQIRKLNDIEQGQGC